MPNLSLEDIFKLIKEENSKLNEKIDKFNEEVKNLSNSLKTEITVIKARVNSLEEDNSELKIKLETIERKEKQNKLIFYGTAEAQNETETDLINNIEEIIKEKLQLEFRKSDISNCYRIGKNTLKNRPILLATISQLKRNEILRNGRKFKGTNIFVQEDLIKKDLEERKILIKHMQAARSKNKKAVLKGNKLYIEGEQFTVKELELDEPNHSPLVHRRANSEPPTPSQKEIEEEIEEKEQEHKFEKELNENTNKCDKVKKPRKTSVDITPKRTNPIRTGRK